MMGSVSSAMQSMYCTAPHDDTLSPVRGAVSSHASSKASPEQIPQLPTLKSPRQYAPESRVFLSSLALSPRGTTRPLGWKQGKPSLMSNDQMAQYLTPAAHRLSPRQFQEARAKVRSAKMHEWITRHAMGTLKPKVCSAIFCGSPPMPHEGVQPLAARIY